MPEHLAVARIEREEIALSIAGEQQIARGRQDATVTNVGHGKMPDLLARAGIERQNGTVANGVRPGIDRLSTEAGQVRRTFDGTRKLATAKDAPGYVLDFLRPENRAVVLPGGQIEKFRLRTV